LSPGTNREKAPVFSFSQRRKKTGEREGVPSARLRRTCCVSRTNAQGKVSFFRREKEGRRKKNIDDAAFGKSVSQWGKETRSYTLVGKEKRDDQKKEDHISLTSTSRRKKPPHKPLPLERKGKKRKRKKKGISLNTKTNLLTLRRADSIIFYLVGKGRRGGGRCCFS